MRLTLRTLLAWIDDTLEPDQVREIARQVEETQFAQELRDRIHRVKRQRRLSVPSSSGADATDPNIVAAYLDNDLDPDGVAEFEKRCLTFDVNLAEVASVHQILSSLGQKVKVPDAARLRMYQLVKGREAIVPRRPLRARRKPAKEPITKPIQPWVMPETPKRPWIERYGPAAACLLLIVLASATAWKSLTMPPTPASAPAISGGVPAAAAPAGQPGNAAESAVAAAAAQPQPAASATPEHPTPPAPAPSEEMTAKGAAPAGELARSDRTEVPVKPRPAPTVAVPAGAVGVAEKPDGILLRYNEDRREWQRLVEETPLKVSDRVLCLDPFRARIDVGKLRLVLVGETEVKLLPQESESDPAVELVQGRILIRDPGTSTLKVTFAGQTVAFEMTPEAEFGIERADRNPYGQPIRQPLFLGVLCQQGEVTVKASGPPQTLKAMNVALIDPAGKLQAGSGTALPAWLGQPEPTPYEVSLTGQFLKMFHPGRPVLAELVAAIEDDRPENKGLAIHALKALGDLSLLLPTLSRPDDPVGRRATVAAIHDYMVQGPEASARVRAALEEQFGAELGGVAHHMLIGYTPEEIVKPDLYQRLVGLLSPEMNADGIVGIRELALFTLKRLTDRDDLGYNPDRPAGKGFEAWNELLRRDELRPKAPRTAPGGNRR